jgi:hypothetical protein
MLSPSSNPDCRMPGFGTCFGKRRPAGIQSARKHWWIEWKPKCIPTDVKFTGQVTMWVVWSMGALVAVCLLLSTFDGPPYRRGMHGTRRD